MLFRSVRGLWLSPNATTSAKAIIGSVANRFEATGKRLKKPQRQANGSAMSLWGLDKRRQAAGSGLDERYAHEREQSLFEGGDGDEEDVALGRRRVESAGEREQVRRGSGSSCAVGAAQKWPRW